MEFEQVELDQETIINNELFLTVVNAINDPKQELIQELKRAFNKSLLMKKVDSRVIRVVIDEYGDIYYSVINKQNKQNYIFDKNEYVLYEFECMDIIHHYQMNKLYQLTWITIY